MPNKISAPHGESTTPTSVFSPKVPTQSNGTQTGSYTTKVPTTNYSRRESPKPTNVFKK